MLRWMLWDFCDYGWPLVRVMAWSWQAASLYLSQCWPKSVPIYCYWATNENSGYRTNMLIIYFNCNLHTHWYGCWKNNHHCSVSSETDLKNSHQADFAANCCDFCNKRQVCSDGALVALHGCVLEDWCRDGEGLVNPISDGFQRGLLRIDSYQPFKSDCNDLSRSFSNLQIKIDGLSLSGTN